MIKFTIREVEFLQANEGCRVATCAKNVPHIAPVTYHFEKGYFYFATDYDTKKYMNLKKNNKIAISVDIYSPVKHKAVIAQGSTSLSKKVQSSNAYTTFSTRNLFG